MTGPGNADIEDDVDELRTRLDSIEESLEALHNDMEIVLAFIDDRNKTQQPPQQSPQPNDRN